MNALNAATQQAREFEAAHSEYCFEARRFARGFTTEEPQRPAFSWYGEQGRVSWRITLAGNSRRQHARITFKIDGKRASREEVAKLA